MLARIYAHSYAYRLVSVRLCHKSVFYQHVREDRAGFGGAGILSYAVGYYLQVWFE